MRHMSELPLAVVSSIATQRLREPGSLSIDLRRGQAVAAPDARLQYCVQVVSGALRICRPLADGRRQITGFLFPGDWAGLHEAREHHASIEAVSQSRVRLVLPHNLRSVPAALHADPSAAIESLFRERLQQAQARILVLGHKNAREKLASFLLEASHRLADGGDVIALPMPRADIADYLCLSAETVCRNFTQFVADGFIALPHPQSVHILRRGPLEFLGL